VIWHNGSVLVSIIEVNLRRVRSVLGWVTVSRLLSPISYTRFCTGSQATNHSARRYGGNAGKNPTPWRRQFACCSQWCCGAEAEIRRMPAVLGAAGLL